MKKIFKKSTIFLIAISLFSSSFLGFFMPTPAMAVGPVPTHEANEVFLGEVTGILSAENADLSQDLKEWAETLLTETLKKKLLDFLVDQVISYINGDGGGGFVSDWGEFLRGVAGDTLREFGDEVAGIDLCSPFSAQLKLNFSGSNVRSFSERSTCTLDDIVGNIENFADDFSNGGWIAYNTAWEPNNNFVGVALSAALEQSGRVSRDEHTALSEIKTGAGFLSHKECEEDPNSSGPDLDGDGNAGDISSACRTITPGSTVADLVSKSLGSNIEYISNAENLNSYVSAIVDAAMNRVLSEGLNLVTSLTAGSSSSSGGFSGSNNIADYIDPNVLGVSGIRKIQQDATSLKDRIQTAIDDRLNGQKIFDLSSDDLILSNAETALSALQYMRNQISKVTQSRQLRNNGETLCQPYYSVNIVQRKQIPLIELYEESTKKIIEIIEQSTRISGKSPNEEEIEYLESKIVAVDNLLDELADADSSDEQFLSDLNFRILVIENSIASEGYGSKATTYLQNIKTAKKRLFDIYASFHGYTRSDQNFVLALYRCFVPLSLGGVVEKFSSTSSPSIPFPWESY